MQLNILLETMILFQKKKQLLICSVCIIILYMLTDKLGQSCGMVVNAHAEDEVLVSSLLHFSYSTIYDPVSL